MEILLATTNRHKVEEISHLLKSHFPSLLIRSLLDFPAFPPVEETEPALEGNALKKASAAYDATGILSMADDTGLECYYLGLEPGVLSARYAGEGATYAENNRKLLKALKGVAARRRTARFRSVVAIVGKGYQKLVEGSVEGRLLEAPRGSDGFGYDPLFVPDGSVTTYAEMTLEEKNTLSHRAMALRKAIATLENISFE
jgi:XTP/dITP diphosphohydrolase